MTTNNLRFVTKNGLDNNGNSITNIGVSGSSLTMSGANAVTITTSGTTNVTFPTSGTLVTTTSGTATTATNLAAGGANTVVYQSASGTTAYLTNGTTGQVLIATTGSAPSWAGAPAGTLTGTTLNSTVVSSSLTSVGTLGSLAVTGTHTQTGALNLAGASSPLQVGGSAGNLNDVLTSGGAGTTPTWAPASASTLVNAVTFGTTVASQTLTGIAATTTSGINLTIKGSSTTTVTPGTVSLIGGDVSAGSSVVGGAVVVIGGVCTTASSQTGGSATLQGGATNSSAGTGGAAIVIGGSSSNGGSGNAQITGGGTTTGLAGDVVIQGGIPSNVTGGGGKIVFSTVPASTNALVERLRIVQSGAWGLNGATFGSTGQALISQGNAAAPIWGTPSTATTATTATNIAGGGANQIAYQSGVGATTFSNTFTYSGTVLSLGSNSSPLTISQTQLASATQISLTVNAGDVSTSNSVGSMTLRGGDMTSGSSGQNGGSLTIRGGNTASIGPTNGGAVTINGGNSTAAGPGGAVTISGGTGTTTGGAIIFQTASTTSLSERMRITAAGALTFSGGSAGTNGQVPISNSSGVPVWTNQSSMSVGTATNLAGGTTNQVPYQTGAGATSFYSSSNYGVATFGSTGVPASIAGAAGVLQGSASAIPAFTTTPTLTGTNFSGIPNSALVGSGALTLGSTSMALGSTTTTVAGLTSVTSTTFVGALTGHASSDLALSGGTMSGAIAMGSNSITGLPSTQSSDSSSAASKAYVDQIAAAVNVHNACETSTTAASNLGTNTYTAGSAGGSPDAGAGVGAYLQGTPATAVLGTIGGYSGLSVGSRVLVKDQSTTTQNGIYTVSTLGDGVSTPWKLIRASDYDNSTYGQVKAGDVTYVQEGTNAGTQWVQTSIGSQSPGDCTKIGTDAIVFSQFAGSGTYIQGTGISIASNVISNTGVLSLTTSSGLSTNTSATGNVSITNTGVTALTGTTNQVTVSASTGSVTLSLPQNINSGAAPTFAGTNFSGTAASLNIGGTAPAGTLTGSTLASGVTASSLTSVGTLGSLTVTNNISSTGGILIGGNATATNGAIILEGNYSNGSLTTLGSEYSSGGAVLAYAVTPSISAGAAFVSSTGITANRGALIVSDAVRFYFGGSQTVAIGSAVTTTLGATISSTGFTGSGAGLTNIPNGALTNSSITVNGTGISLGGSGTVTAAAGTLTGTTLNATVVSSSLTSVGTLGSLAVTGNISSLGNVYAGTTTPQTPYTTGAVSTFAAEKAATYTGISAYAYSTTASSGGVLVLGRSRNATLGTLGATSSGDGLGAVSFEGVNSSSALTSGAYIYGKQDGAGGATFIPGRVEFYTATNAAGPTERMRLDSSGNLLIGTTSASSLLTVNGTVTATAFNATSTKRVKKAIKDIGQKYLSKFADLKPREFDRKDYKAHEFGFVAEEMALVYPEVVGKDNEGKPNGIDYGRLSAILTAKVQEQQSVIDKLQEQMAQVLGMLKGAK